ncbi:hypothetical protein AB0E01_18110 [Nocardia vinacea]|uniref:hypothetical protein n=1 Tax=Nocardia vinacea TaxID=96468 RepID=UPI0033D1196F
MSGERGGRLLRARILERVVDRLLSSRSTHPVRVAVDGITAAGKTTWAREIAGAVEARGRQAIHVSMDGFHHLRAHRYRQGRESARGYYEDAYDFDALARHVLEPLGPRGDLRFRSRVMDLATDTEVDDVPSIARPDAVVVIDGSFLQRDLRRLWDVVVFIDADFAAARDRGTQRDAVAFGGVEAAGLAYEQRYHAASQEYLDQVRPAELADIVIANSDPTRPVLRRVYADSSAAVQDPA